MILKLGRIVDGKIVATEWFCTQETAVACMWAEEEIVRSAQLFESSGPDGITMLGPPAAVAHDQARGHPWLLGGWNDYLASKPASYNPRRYGRIGIGGQLILPPGVTP